MKQVSGLAMIIHNYNLFNNLHVHLLILTYLIFDTLVINLKIYSIQSSCLVCYSAELPSVVYLFISSSIFNMPNFIYY